jgi:hypothetical protein
LRPVDFFAVDLRAVDFRAVDFFLAGDIGHLLPLKLRTPSVSGVDALVRSSRPTRRIAHRGGGRS